MSEDDQRDKVFLTTRVRSSLKNDASWIQTPENGQEDSSDNGTTPPPLVRGNSYVNTIAKKFEAQVCTEESDPNVVAPPEKLDEMKPDEQQATNATVENGEGNLTASDQCSESKPMVDSSEVSSNIEENNEEHIELSDEKQIGQMPEAQKSGPEIGFPNNETQIVAEEIEQAKYQPEQADVTSTDPAEVDAQEEEIKDVTSNVESAAPSCHFLSNNAEVKCDSDVQSSENIVETGPAPLKELNILDALDSGISSDESTKDIFVARPIEVTDALDVDTTNDASTEDPQTESHAEVTEQPRISDDKDIIETVLKPEEPPSAQALNLTSNGVAVCSFCDQVIDGNIKISLNEPPISSHPECLKCAVCACVLGNLTSPMFLCRQQIQCEICSANPTST